MAGDTEWTPHPTQVVSDLGQLTAFGDPDLSPIIRILQRQEATVQDLARMLQVPDASIETHLQCLVDLALKNPVGFGYGMAFAELAVGLGVLVGLLSRLAALGGALISLSLWLTVSWSTTPYYYGNDLAYLMAWLPLVLAGAPVLSLDAVLRARRRGME